MQQLFFLIYFDKWVQNVFESHQENKPFPGASAITASKEPKLRSEPRNFGGSA
jgi:hypothetical protein